ncbi:hypothetical protein HDU81_008199 [Chytriomyces hyalinus]|nr:hypothetical protein HDU81_008199 [Chytriomyces hyalinus]
MKQLESNQDTPITLSIEVKNYGQTITFPLCPPYASKARMDAYRADFSYIDGLCTITLPWDTVNRNDCFKTTTNKVDVDTKLTASLDTISASVTHALHVDFTGDALKTKVNPKRVVGAVDAKFVMQSLEYEKNGTLTFELGVTVDRTSTALPEYFGVRFIEGITGQDDAPALTRAPKTTDFIYFTTVPCNTGSVAKSYVYVAKAFSCFNGATSNSEENDSDDECHMRYPQTFVISFKVDPTCTISYEINNNIVDATLTDGGSIVTTKLLPDKPWKLALNSTFLAGLRLNINVKTLTITFGKSGTSAKVDLSCFKPVQTAGNTTITFTAASFKTAATAPSNIYCPNNVLDAFILPNIDTYTFDIGMEFVTPPASRRRRDDSAPKTGSATVTVAVESITKLASEGITIGGGLVGSALVAGAALLF